MRNLMRDNLWRGFLMGGADIIPGVSGGTVALILGIYGRLVTAISCFDLSLLAHLKKRNWKLAIAHVDGFFLLSLGLGIALGIGSLASLMHYLLTHHMQETFGLFFGLILASTVLVARMVPRLTGAVVFFGLLGLVFAYWLVGQIPGAGSDSLIYLFLSGAVAICAMILPGISGAFILLLLGKYEAITGMLRAVLKGQGTSEMMLQIIVFVAGCGLGLLAFSKILKWLLSRYEAITLSLLCGFMAGSLRKIWPFKLDLTPNVEKLKLKQFENTWPHDWNSSTWLTWGLIVAALLLVFFLDRLGRKFQKQTLEAAVSRGG